jgi:amino acid permease
MEKTRKVETSELPAERLASNKSSYANITNSTLGAGILGLPFAFASTGWIIGPILLVLTGLYSMVGLHLITCVCAKTGFPATIFSCSQPVHRFVPLFMDLLMALTLFGALSAYLVVMGDMMPQACTQFGLSGAWLERYVWVLVGFGIATPLSIPNRLDFLKYTSAICILAVLYVTGVVFIFALPGQDPCAGLTSESDDDLPCIGSQIVGEGINYKLVLKAIGIFVSGFCCQINSFPVISESKKATVANMDKVFGASLATSGSIYLVVAVCGYHAYGSSIRSDLLLSYPVLPAVSVARLMITIVVVFSYPLIVFPARKSILSIVHFFLDPDPHVWPDERMGRIRYYVVTACLLSMTLLVGLTVTDLGDVLSVTGATGGVTIMFILPGGLYLWYFPDPSSRRAKGKDHHAVLNKPLISSLSYDKNEDEEDEEGEDEAFDEERGEDYVYKVEAIENPVGAAMGIGMGAGAGVEQDKSMSTQSLGSTASDRDLASVASASTDRSQDRMSRASVSTVIMYGLNDELARDMPIPKPSTVKRALAWLQLVTGLVLLFVCVTAIFI